MSGALRWELHEVIGSRDLFYPYHVRGFIVEESIGRRERFSWNVPSLANPTYVFADGCRIDETAKRLLERES